MWWDPNCQRDVFRHSSVMRDLLFSRVTLDFPWKFPWWLISFETRSRDRNRQLWHQLLALFPRHSTSDFLRTNHNRILVDVVNILFYFSVIRDRLKEIGAMRDRSPPLTILQYIPPLSPRGLRTFSLCWCSSLPCPFL